MTPDQLTALAARLRDHASDYITHPDDACKHSDLLAASEHLRQCAESEHAIVPQGWKLVPLEPTTEMVEAAFDAIPASLLDGKIRTHYRAMLAAAPQPPSAKDDAVEALRRIIEAANGRQHHNPITDEMHAALRYARAVLAAQGGGNAE